MQVSSKVCFHNCTIANQSKHVNRAEASYKGQSSSPACSELVVLCVSEQCERAYTVQFQSVDCSMVRHTGCEVFKLTVCKGIYCTLYTVLCTLLDCSKVRHTQAVSSSRPFCPVAHSGLSNHFKPFLFLDLMVDITHT